MDALITKGEPQPSITGFRATRARKGFDMTTGRGCLRVLTASWAWHVKATREGFCAYVRSAPFLTAFTKARHPLVRPRPIDTKRAHKVDWRDPAMRAKLADAATHKGSALP